MNNTPPNEISLTQQVSWEPFKSASGRLGRPLSVESTDRLAYRAGVPVLALLWLHFLLGLAPIFLWTVSRSALGGAFDAPFDLELGTLLFCVVLLLLSGGSIIHFCKPHVFDKRLGWYWHGWIAPQHSRRPRRGRQAVRLELIQALQLLSYETKVEFQTATLHELNLVLLDGSRVNVRCNVYGQKMKSEAQVLSAFLGVPILERP